jgi:hypothetical protein
MADKCGLTQKNQEYGEYRKSNFPDFTESSGTEDAGLPVSKRGRTALHPLGDLAGLSRDMRHESFKFLSLPDLFSYRRTSKAGKEDVREFFKSNGGGLRLVHSPELFAASDAYFSNRSEQARRELDQVMKRPGCECDETFSLLLGDASDRTFDMLIKSKLVPARALSLDLPEAHRKFLCSNWAVRQLYRRADVDFEAFARIPEALLAPMGLHLAIGAGDLDALEAMLRCKLFDINAANDYGVTPLNAAQYFRNDGAADMLIRYGADASSTAADLMSRRFANAECPDGGWVPLDIDQVPPSS